MNKTIQLLNRKHVAKLALTLFMIAFGTCVLNAATLTVRCNNSSATYSTIGAAVLAANSGDTIKVSGVCTENVLVSKSLTIMGPAKLVPGASGGNGFFVNVPNVSISGFDIAGFNIGIQVAVLGGCTIKGNTIHGNNEGILFLLTKNNSVKQNVITRNSGDGIYDYVPEGPSTYSGNTITYNGSSAGDPASNSGIEIRNATFPAVITANFIQRNAADGVYLNNAKATVNANDLSWNGLDGLGLNYPGSGTSQASFNFVNKNRRYGIFVSSDITDVSLQRNVALGNLIHDAHDDSSGSGTGGTANSWKLNVCQTTSPAGLCFAF